VPTLPEAKEQSAAVALVDLISGCVITQSIYVAAKLGIADVLADAPLTAEEIAKRVGADREAIYRLLRTLSSYSVFAELTGGRFELTPIGDALRASSPHSMRNRRRRGWARHAGRHGCLRPNLAPRTRPSPRHGAAICCDSEATGRSYSVLNRSWRQRPTAWSASTSTLPTRPSSCALTGNHGPLTAPPTSC
jgi:hypothetical protein